MSYSHFYFNTFSEAFYNSNKENLDIATAEEETVISIAIVCGALFLSGIGYIFMEKICNRLENREITVRNPEEELEDVFRFLDP